MTRTTTLGRPVSDATQLALPKMRVLRAQGNGYRMIARKLDAAGYRTTHGGRWRPGTVRVALLRSQRGSSRR